MFHSLYVAFQNSTTTVSYQNDSKTFLQILKISLNFNKWFFCLLLERSISHANYFNFLLCFELKNVQSGMLANYQQL